MFTELLSWTEDEGVSEIVGGEANRLVYNYSFLFPAISSLIHTTECHTSDYEFDHHPHRGDDESFLQAECSA